MGAGYPAARLAARPTRRRHRYQKPWNKNDSAENEGPQPKRRRTSGGRSPIACRPSTFGHRIYHGYLGDKGRKNGNGRVLDMHGQGHTRPALSRALHENGVRPSPGANRDLPWEQGSGYGDKDMDIGRQAVRVRGAGGVVQERWARSIGWIR